MLKTLWYQGKDMCNCVTIVSFVQTSKTEQILSPVSLVTSWDLKWNSGQVKLIFLFMALLCEFIDFCN